MFQNKGAKSKPKVPEPLLGDPIHEAKKPKKKAKVTGLTHAINERDIRIHEFLFQSLPNPPNLEGVDEDRLLEIQRNLQEQLHQRDEKRERNITKRVKEFKKKFNFVNSHLLKGVPTMAALTKSNARQPIGKINLLIRW